LLNVVVVAIASVWWRAMAARMKASTPGRSRHVCCAISRA
jgi:hypothetical protein